MPSTFPEIDLHNALALYALDNGADLSENNCWELAGDTRGGYSSIDSVSWTHSTIPAPTEAELISLYDSWLAQVQTDLAQQADVQSINEARQQLIRRVQRELIAPAVDIPVLKADLEGIITSNSKAQTAFDRTAALWDIDTTTNKGYIQVCYLLAGVAT